ncbi:MAG TPA: caspase family protein [Nitrospiraceae bacterium]|nr:caspase family protein [Nitrospiraceae bacterium]
MSLFARRVLLLFLLLAFPFTAYGQIGKPEGLYYKSWGLVIGIENYLVAPKVDGAVADAKAVAHTLRQLGFDEVVELYNKDASFRRLNSIFTDYLPRKVGRMDRVVIFFAGHAGTTQDMNGKDLGYLVPWDAQVGNATKAVTLDYLKDFSRRMMSKHVFFLFDAGLTGWDVTPPQQLSLEGRISPEAETEKRAVQILTAAGKGESVARRDGADTFVQAVISGLGGAADLDNNGWVMASELGGYVAQQVEQQTEGAQHPQFARLDGEGDTVLIEGKKSSYRVRPEPKTEAERIAAAKEEYEQAFSMLQQQQPLDDAIARLNKALQYNPTYGDAYVLKSFVYLELSPNLQEATAAAEKAVKYAPENPDAPYTLGLIHQKKGQFAEAEQAMRQALAINPNYSDVYLSLGDLYAEDLKDKEKAIDAYRRYLETGGTDNRARNYLQENGGMAPPTKQ